jgi:hypothetical protein
VNNKDPNILSQVKKAHSIESIVTLISFALNVFVGRIKELDFLIIPLVIIVSLTIIASSYFLFQSV